MIKILIASLALVWIANCQDGSERYQAISIPNDNNELNCSCAGGEIYVYDYETIPLAHTGAGCIGGCGGNPFMFHDPTSELNAVKNI